MQDIFNVFHQAKEVLCPPRVEQDLSEVLRILFAFPTVCQRYNYYVNLGVHESEFTEVPNQSSLDSLPRHRLISVYLQAYCDQGSQDWLDTLLRYFPSKEGLCQLVTLSREQDISEIHVLMLALESGDITNEEIFFVGW